MNLGRVWSCIMRRTTNRTAVPSAKVQVRTQNLAFSATAERLVQVFRGLSGFSFETKPDPKRPTVPGAEAPRLSMGYGFVGFKTAEDAKKAMEGMQGFILDGHSLHVKFAGRGTEDEPKDNTAAKSRSTKMIVKNVPFEATKKDIRELFSAHGHLKSVRLPKKFDSRSWSSSPGTKRRMHMLHYDIRIYLGDILYFSASGRKRLNRTEVLRKKAGMGYGDGAELPGRKQKRLLLSSRRTVLLRTLQRFLRPSRPTCVPLSKLQVPDSN
ncbi:hypothetical protein F4604DRAFT_1960472 [Suillus subluteus]|nr:hypothetical protein F4604DRAFT_1960472 [Suillus subluteus]